jgi:hypothetical protein
MSIWKPGGRQRLKDELPERIAWLRERDELPEHPPATQTTGHDEKMYPRPLARR